MGKAWHCQGRLVCERQWHVLLGVLAPLLPRTESRLPTSQALTDTPPLPPSGYVFPQVSSHLSSWLVSLSDRRKQRRHQDRDTRWSAAEPRGSTQDSQCQIPTLASRYKSLKPFKLFHLGSEAVAEIQQSRNVQRFRGGLVFKARRLCVSHGQTHLGRLQPVVAGRPLPAFLERDASRREARAERLRPNMKERGWSGICPPPPLADCTSPPKQCLREGGGQT